MEQTAGLETTVALIKPDAVARGRATAILDEIEAHFRIVDSVLTTWDTAAASRFYEEHKGKPFFADLVTFMTSGPLLFLTLEAPDARNKWRSMMGATDPAKADAHSIRARYAAHDGVMMHNCVHGSDSLASVVREIVTIRALVSQTFGSAFILAPLPCPEESPYPEDDSCTGECRLNGGRRCGQCMPFRSV